MESSFELLQYALKRGASIWQKKPMRYLLIVLLYFLITISINTIYDYFFLSSEDAVNDYYQFSWIKTFIDCVISSFFVSTLVYNIHSVEMWKNPNKPSFLAVIQESGFKYWFYFSVFNLILFTLLSVSITLITSSYFSATSRTGIFLLGYNYMRMALFSSINIVCIFVPFFTIIEKIPILRSIKESLYYVKKNLVFFVFSYLVIYYIAYAPINTLFMFNGNTTFKQHLEFFNVSFYRPFGMMYYGFLVFTRSYLACFAYAIYERFVLQKDTFLEEKISQIGGE